MSQTATNMTTVLHPAAEEIYEGHALAPRLDQLQGITVGLIDNHKKNSDVYLDELERLLKDEFGVAQVRRYRKISQSMPTPDEVLDELAKECDATIHAVAD